MRYLIFSLQKNVPYFVKLRVTNCAGLSVVKESPPVFVDFSLPTPGVVKNGLDFQSDRLWFSDPTSVQGKATQLQFPHPQILSKAPLFKCIHHLQFNLQKIYSDIKFVDCIGILHMF